MQAPATVEEFMTLVRQANLVDEKSLDPRLWEVGPEELPKSPPDLADFLVQEGVLTGFQAVQLLKGKLDMFVIGPFRVLERLGHGAASNVYYCEDKRSRQHVAVKVLTQLKSQDDVALKRFYREARAAARLQHPNIVRVRDVDHDSQNHHYMVMDYVDGASLQDIVQRSGVMAVNRAAHYIRQTAEGLQYAHQAGLVHRDIKPANLLVDREGVIRILDMGLARFAQEEMDVLTRGEILGQPEYLAPEQAADSHNVDIRADIYSLGATFYFLLMGEPPYAEEKTLAKKLLAKGQRPPKPILETRTDVPAELVAVIDKMMHKDRNQRYATPIAVAEALSPWTQAAIAPPSEAEIPQLSPAARASAGAAKTARAVSTAAKPATRGASSPAGKSEPGSPPPRRGGSGKVAIATKQPAETVTRSGREEPSRRSAAAKAASAKPVIDNADSDEDEEQSEVPVWSPMQVLICAVLAALIGLGAWWMFNNPR